MSPDPSSPDPDPAERCTIAVQNPCRYRQVAVRRLRPWLVQTVEVVAPGARALTVRFTSDREIRRLNRTFRGKDEATDVLSFPGDLAGSASCGADPFAALEALDAAAAPSTAAGRLGEVVVAVPTATRQASRLGHGIDRELRELVLHGLLHCLGHDHETDDGEMDRLERRLRRQLIADD